MTSLQAIFLRNGFWFSEYEPYEMPGTYCRVRYLVIPTDGGELPADGIYKGFVPFENVLRLVHGGEYTGNYIINQEIRDFSIVFDQPYHDEFRAGLERGYKKRACSLDYFCGRPEVWRDGYRAGRQYRLGHQRQRSAV